MKWLEEIEIDKSKARQTPLTGQEVSQLRGALGTMSWRSTQTGPQFLAEISLLLSEISRGTIETLYKTNKLIREMRRDAGQGLLFPSSWQVEKVQDLAVITWADASQHNRPDRSSTLGILSGVAPKEILQGIETQVALVQWKSGKTPRQCLGSNGAEVQAITLGEDQNHAVRMLLAELGGVELRRGDLHLAVQEVAGALVMDSKGIFDAMTRNMSSLHGLRDSRAGYELTLAVSQAVKAKTQLRWVNGNAQLGDALTKFGARKILLHFFAQRQHWRLIHDPKFEAGKKVHKADPRAEDQGDGRARSCLCMPVEKVGEQAQLALGRRGGGCEVPSASLSQRFRKCWGCAHEVACHEPLTRHPGRAGLELRKTERRVRGLDHAGPSFWPLVGRSPFTK